MAKQLDALTAIAALLAPGAKRAGDLAKAWDDPDDYADDHAAELELRGIDGVVDHLPWLALIELLAHADALVELDGAPDAETLRRAIERLEGCPRGAFAWMKHDAELAERSPAELLELAGKALLAKRVQLVQLDGEALRLCLVVVAAARAAELVKLAKAAGYGDATRLTGARLTKATKDRTAAAKRASRTASARNGKHAQTVRYFARGKETWTVSVPDAGDDAEAKYETCYEKPRVKYYVHHYFDDAAAARAGLKRQLAEWAAAGFHELDQAEFAALPHADTAYINWTGPFPEDASYVVEGKEIVRCLELRGEAIVESAGTIGYNFGELQSVYHCKTAAAAAKRHAQHLAADAHFPAIARAEVVRRYR